MVVFGTTTLSVLASGASATAEASAALQSGSLNNASSNSGSGLSKNNQIVVGVVVGVGGTFVFAALGALFYFKKHRKTTTLENVGFQF